MTVILNHSPSSPAVDAGRSAIAVHVASWRRGGFLRQATSHAMKLLYTLLLAVGVFASGCDMLHTRQYEVSGVVASSADAAKLRAVLQGVAEKSGLTESPSVSNSPDCFFLHTGGNLVILEASFYHDSALIQLDGGYGTPPEYRQAKRLLAPALSTEFGSRFSVPKKFIQQ